MRNYRRRRCSRAVPARLCQTERAAVGEAVHRPQYRAHARGLQSRQIVVKPSRRTDLTFQSLKDNSATIDNIRLWDWQPLIDTYAQLQEIRTYYRFHDADIDRYDLGGTYQQVMLSARELEPSLLSANAQTWVNLHVFFTHGNGVVMSPVTQNPAEGLPIFYLQDIPPIASGGPPSPSRGSISDEAPPAM